MTQCLQAIHSSLQASCLGDTLWTSTSCRLGFVHTNPEYSKVLVGTSWNLGSIWSLATEGLDPGLGPTVCIHWLCPTGGLAKTPTYWLGGFISPQDFLNVVQQVTPSKNFVTKSQATPNTLQSVIKSWCSLSGPAEQVMYVTDLTAWDKYHVCLVPSISYARPQSYTSSYLSPVHYCIALHVDTWPPCWGWTLFSRRIPLGYRLWKNCHLRAPWCPAKASCLHSPPAPPPHHHCQARAIHWPANGGKGAIPVSHVCVKQKSQ